MSLDLGKYRARFAAKGLGNMEVREVSPSAGTDFSNLGYIDDEGTEIGDVYTEQIYKDEAGNVANIDHHSHLTTLATNLQQVGIDELNLVRQAAGKVHALRYCGKINPDIYQYFCLEQAKINPNMSRKFNPGKQKLPFRAVGIKQDDSSFDTPELYVVQTNGLIRTQNLQLWVEPRIGLNTETAKLLDISGFGRVGTLNSDYAAIWQQTTTPAEFLRFDGANDGCDFGDILDDDGVSDFLIECWSRPQSSDATDCLMLSKRTTTADISAGWSFWRRNSGAGKFRFQIADGSTQAIIESNAFPPQNVWKHLAVSIDRNGNGQTYINGIADGSPVSTAAVGSAANSQSLKIGRSGSEFGQVDIGGHRFYNFGAGNLPSDIATIISNHYNAERQFYGL